MCIRDRAWTNALVHSVKSAPDTTTVLMIASNLSLPSSPFFLSADCRFERQWRIPLPIPPGDFHRGVDTGVILHCETHLASYHRFSLPSYTCYSQYRPLQLLSLIHISITINILSTLQYRKKDLKIDFETY